ncbi:MarR family winged helix-turn-helix transcriptional regulator [Aestuariivirga litoralis]|uniref:MarR family winged helix-turn-helix transcriptional regulator n=1 Tax=Aestuariivirga litoralis TaxID=2650924 RepID=UPI0018C70881|nr:MarR family winged helix-turn-helix transcriptional regulator [Aestuariivirga litoralis]
MSVQKEIKPFARSFSHLLKRAVQYSVHLYMEEVGKSGLTHRQFTVLAAVDSFEGKSQTELVKVTGIDRSTLADVVARLMAQGYLQRKRSKEDARTNAIRLTPVGKKMLRGCQSGAEDIDRKLLAHFAGPDRKVVLECLAGLGAEMDKIDANTPEPENAAGNGKVKLKRKPVV